MDREGRPHDRRVPVSEKPIYYVKAGKAPANWRDLVVKRRGRVVPDIVEADAFNGWFVQAVRNKAGDIEKTPAGVMRTRRVEAKIVIEPRSK